jgi:hypothetical protein
MGDNCDKCEKPKDDCECYGKQFPNLDAMPTSELLAFAVRYGTVDDEDDDRIVELLGADYDSRGEQGNPPIVMVRRLASYANWRLAAMGMRLAGDIYSASLVEAELENLYKGLNDRLKW